MGAFQGALAVKNPPTSQGELGSSLSWEDPSWEVVNHSSFLQEIPMDRGIWWAGLWGYNELDTTKAAEHKVYIDMQEGVIIGIGSCDYGG